VQFLANRAANPITFCEECGFAIVGAMIDEADERLKELAGEEEAEETEEEQRRNRGFGV
jgi:hypothetical protein